MLKLSKSEMICMGKNLPHYYKHFVEILNLFNFYKMFVIVWQNFLRTVWQNFLRTYHFRC